MRTPLRLALSVVVAAAFGLASARAQKPAPGPQADPSANERKELEERLNKLMKELKELEARRAAEQANPAPRKPNWPQEPTPDKPKPTAQGFEFRAVPRPSWEPMPLKPGAANPDPTRAALEKLAASGDPKVAELARELMRIMPKPGANPLTFRGGGLEFRLVPESAKPGAPAAEPGQKPRMLEAGERRIVIIGEKAVGKPEAGPAVAGGSTLRMSADGKTAAVVAADGTVTVYDVASGRELMRFPGKR